MGSHLQEHGIFACLCVHYLKKKKATVIHRAYQISGFSNPPLRPLAAPPARRLWYVPAARGACREALRWGRWARAARCSRHGAQQVDARAQPLQGQAARFRLPGRQVPRVPAARTDHPGRQGEVGGRWGRVSELRAFRAPTRRLFMLSA